MPWFRISAWCERFIPRLFLTSFIVHREIRERMTGSNVETITRRARERGPDPRPRINVDRTGLA